MMYICELIDIYFISPCLMDKNERSTIINEKFKEFRGCLMPYLWFDSQEIPYVEYYYDETDDCLHANNAIVPFHYEVEDINLELFDRCLNELHLLVREEYKKNGILLKFYDD